VVPGRSDTLLESFEGFDEFLVLRERRGGLQHLVVMPKVGEPYEIEFADPTYSIYFGINVEPSVRSLRYVYTSMTTPNSTYRFDMAAGTQELLKREKIGGGFDPDNYESRYLWATARDGVQVPISIVYRKDQLDRGHNPLLLYSYGSYGISSRAGFDPARLSLLDRGFVWATAHIRGGQEMGREWYEDGKLLKKMNTFTDFIDCGRYLAADAWCDADRIYGYGGSAGGLLIGAVINLAPDLLDGAVARVPFVDVVTTMLDESIPLTTSEWDEWGDPRVELYYDYMLSYSPYDQVRAVDYPELLVTAGLHDSQVQYFEPAKWVAKLRATKTGDGLVLLETNMEAGHGGASGRLSRMKETALIYAFVISLAGEDDPSF
jgi:oligopeptidase B